ncbi:MAG: DNA polymerase IV [Lachnospiraceae bacterium]|jgi:nucleotidyltransferase/DNA polymerase involved in DNA repair|nr:DNA polymerase IV [Lachnospiraceae bacterium]
MSPVIFHIDVNSAYLSWSALEKLKNGSSVDLRTIPSIIGGDEKSRHGIVLAKSIPAKKYGIHTAEPVASALRKCPTLVMEPPDHKLYHRYSHAMMELLYTFSPDLEQVSIDECYLDFTPIAHLYPSPEEAAARIRDQIFDELHFTVNIGIAHTKVLAKMASDFEKPGKIHTLYPEEIPFKMWPLSVTDLFMVGRRSAEKLVGFGIRTIGDLAHTDPAFLTAHFKSHGRLMWEFANGIDPSPVLSERQEAKGIGNSTTLSEDVADRIEAKKVLLSLCESVSGRLRESGQLAGTITVEIKYHDFTKASHQSQTLSPCSTTNELYGLACSLFDSLWDGRPFRLLGVRSSRLTSESEPIQLSIFDLPAVASESSEGKNAANSPSPEKLRQLDAAMDAIRKKYGEHAIKRGRFL